MSTLSATAGGFFRNLLAATTTYESRHVHKHKLQDHASADPHAQGMNTVKFHIDTGAGTNEKSRPIVCPSRASIVKRQEFLKHRSLNKQSIKLGGMMRLDI